MYEIEKDVHMPKHGWGRKKKYPFEEMDVGDSFFVEVDNPTGKKLHLKQLSILGSARRRRFPDRKFTTRTEEKGVRCWRLQ